MADEKTYSEEDSTATSALQTDEDVEILSRQNEMAGPVDIADDHTHDRSFSNAGFTAGFSVFANNVDGITNLEQNADRSSSFALNEGANSGFGGNMGTGFQVGVSNPGFPGQQFPTYQNSPVQTVEDVLFPERKRRRLPAAGQQLPAYQNIPVLNVEDRLFPARIGLQLSDIEGSAAAAQVVKGQVMPVVRASGPTQACDVPIGQSHKRHTTRFPPIDHSIPCTARLKTPFTHQSTSESAQAAPPLAPVPVINTVPPQGQTAASLSPFPTTAAFLQPAYHSTSLPSQAQTAHPPAPLAKEIPSLHVSKGKSVARGSGLAQASNASVRPSRKRGATQTPSIAHPGQHRATIHSSSLASVQTAPLAHRSQNAPVPTQALNAASFPSFRRTADYLRTLSQSRAVPYPLQTLRPSSETTREIPHIPHTSQDSNRLPQPIGYKCCVCNLDLSLTPEGLVLQPGIPPSITVLRCGHYCHVFCLQWITLADPTENPPCIECQKREMKK